MRRTLPSGRPGGGAGGSVVGRASTGSSRVRAPPRSRRARSPRVHGSNAPNCQVSEREAGTCGNSITRGDKYDEIKICAHMRVLRPVCSRRRLDTNYNVASTPSSRDHPEQSNKRRMPTCNLVRGPYVRLPCTLPMPAARMRPCPIWPHAIQRNWIPSAPEMGQIPDVEPRFPPCT